MKMKTYLRILLVLFLLLGYHLICYWFVHQTIYAGTKQIVKQFFATSCPSCSYSYKIVRATMNDNQSINVFIKVDSKELNEYYRFIVIQNGTTYQLIEVNQDIPGYIEKEWLFV